MKEEKEAIRSNMATHLKDLMSGSELYGWDKVRVYHAVWLNQLEQGCVCWDDEEEKLHFQDALVWHPALTSVPNSPQPPQKQQPWERYC